MYLVFDIGGTNMRIGVSSDGKILQSSKIIPTPQNFDKGILSIKKTADELSGGEKIEKIGGGIAVVFNSDKSIPISTSHLHGWVNKPLKQALIDKFNCPVVLENDTACVGLGEAVFGAGMGKDIIAYITVSTGVGGVRITNKRIDSNNMGFEPGHHIIVINGKDCHCGGKGHFEAYVGGYYLERDFHQKGENIKDATIWEQVTRYLSIGLTNIIVHWSTDVVILGGAVMRSINLEQLEKYLREDLTIFPTLPEIKIATLGDDAGLLGALALLR